MAQSITEKDGLQKDWYEAAKKIASPEELSAFVGHLINDYSHDYGTICHALAAAAVAAACCVDHSPTGGITGFQAGAVMWEFIEHWGAMDKGPKRMLCYSNMLFPQYADNFTERTITKSTWAYLQEEALKNLAKAGHATDGVVAHWQSIVDGHVPFGYSIRED